MHSLSCFTTAIFTLENKATAALHLFLRYSLQLLKPKFRQLSGIQGTIIIGILFYHLQLSNFLQTYELLSIDEYYPRTQHGLL